MNKTRSDRALVLGVSTLWLTIPIIYGIDSIARSKKNQHISSHIDGRNHFSQQCLSFALAK